MKYVVVLSPSNMHVVQINGTWRCTYICSSTEEVAFLCIHHLIRKLLYGGAVDIQKRSSKYNNFASSEDKEYTNLFVCHN